MGLHTSVLNILYLWMEALFLQAWYKFFSFKKWEAVDAEGKVVVITGANSGLGGYVAKYMAQKGATVVMACRDVEKGKQVKQSVMNEGVSGLKMDVVALDLSDLSSVRECAATINRSYAKIDILICNAGVSLNTSKRLYTKDGFELHMGTNHLGHFLLTNLLLDKLKKGNDARVVTVASSAMFMANLSLDDMRQDNTWRGLGYTMHYNNSKIANAFFSKELGKRMKGKGIKAFCICPGFVKDTSLMRNYVGRTYADMIINFIGFPLEKGADIILYCALSKEMQNKTGELHRFGMRWNSGEKLLTNDDFASKLWKKSELLVGLSQ